MRSPLHLVGSIPLEDSTTVFNTVAATVGGALGCIPDGETGPRSRWNSWTAPTYERTAGLELVPPPPGSYTPWQQARLVVAPEDLVLERIGFADAALASFAVFSDLLANETIASGTRFQVCLPSPIAPMTVLIEESSRAGVEAAHLRQLHAEIAEILDAVPHDQLTIQWDVCQDVGIWEGYYPAYFGDREQGVIDRLAACAGVIPTDVELGYHLCYGDFKHKHFMEPDDLGVCAQIAARLTVAAPRAIDYIHMPVPIDRDDDAYFEPLSGAGLDNATTLYLGLIHYDDGLEGAQRRIETARRHAPAFGVGTECGFGRRDPETIVALLELHAEVAAQLDQ